MISFSNWFLHGYEGSPPGYKRILTSWMPTHILVGMLLSLAIDTPIKELSRTILIPLFGIIIGLTFAWAGNAQGFMQTRELIEISKQKPGGYVDYIFVYKLSILTVLISSILWFFAGLDFVDIKLVGVDFSLKRLPFLFKFSMKFILYSSLSIAVHESWSIIQGVHYFLIMKNSLSEREEKARIKKESEAEKNR